MKEQLPIKQKNDAITLKVKVIPRSNKNSIAGIKNNEFIIKIKASPEKGKANAELINFFAKTLHIAKSQIEISFGSKSHHKTILLPAACYENLQLILKSSYNKK